MVEDLRIAAPSLPADPPAEADGSSPISPPPPDPLSPFFAELSLSPPSPP